MPQNIQKRLLLYVLQQLSLFSEIDLPNLEEVSLNNVVLKDVSIDTEKVSKLSGVVLRYGKIGNLELNGGVREGVTIDASDVDMVLAPNFDVSEEDTTSLQKLLAQSTADLANTMFSSESSEKQEEEEEQIGDLETRQQEGTSSSDTSMHARGEKETTKRPAFFEKLKPFTLSSVMSKAVEMALLKLQAKISNISVKILSDNIEFVLVIDKVFFNTTGGVRSVSLSGIKLLTVKPDVNPGGKSLNAHEKESSSGDQCGVRFEANQTEMNDDTGNDNNSSSNSNSNTSNEFDDEGNNYGEESLVNSVVYSPEEASSIYLSATSQTLGGQEGEKRKNSIRNIDCYPVVAHVDEIMVKFQGLNYLTDLKVDIGQVKIALVPLCPTLISVLDSVAKSLRLHLYQKKRSESKDRGNKFNTTAADTHDEKLQGGDQQSLFSHSLFDKLHIDNIVVSCTSLLERNGEFASSEDIRFTLQNFNIKSKNETLIYGGIEKFIINNIRGNEQSPVFEFEHEEALSNSYYRGEGKSFFSPKADVRFEVLWKGDISNKVDVTVLLSKKSNFSFNEESAIVLSHTLDSLLHVYESFKSMRNAMATMGSYTHSKNRELGSLLPRTCNVVLQTSSSSLSFYFNESLSIKLFVLPIFYNSTESVLSINKIFANFLVEGKSIRVLNISDIRFLLTVQEFQSFMYRLDNDKHQNMVTLRSQLTLSLANVDFSVSFKHLKLLIEEMKKVVDSFNKTASSQINSFDNSIINRRKKRTADVRGPFHSPFQHSRHKRKVNMNNGSFFYSMRTVRSRLRVVVDNLAIKIIQIRPKFGDLLCTFNNINLYELNNDIQINVKSFDAAQKYSEREEKVSFIHEFLNRDSKDLKIPMLLLLCCKNDQSSVFEICVQNFIVEYYTSWLELLEREKEELMSVEKEEIKEGGLHGFSGRPVLKLSFYHWAIGLTPYRLSSKLYLDLERSTIDTTFSQHLVYIKCFLRKLNILLIDDISRSTDKGKKATASGSSISSWLVSNGYVSVGNFNHANLGVTITTDLQYFVRRNKALGISEFVSLFDVKMTLDDQCLELCADSGDALKQLLNDLKLPLKLSERERNRVSLNKPTNLYDDIDMEAFGGGDYESGSGKDIQTDDSTTLNESFDPEPKKTSFDMVEDYYDDFVNSDVLEKLKTLHTNELKGDEHEEEENLSLPEEGAGVNEKTCPATINVNISRIRIYLYDGFDWKQTRKSIRGAVKRVQEEAQEERQKRMATKYKSLSSRTDDNVGGHIDTKGSIREPYLDLSHDMQSFEEGLDPSISEKPLQETTENFAEPNLVVGETVYNSIYLSVPEDTEPLSLAYNVNESLYSGTTNKSDIRTKIDFSQNYKNLKLRRSKSHKLYVDLSSLELDFVLFTLRDPRVTDKDFDSDYELVNRVDLIIGDIDVYDNVPTSTWNKFLSYMNLLGEREIGTSIFRLSVINSRPDPSLFPTEARVHISVLPLRLHIDQDTLDFILRFFEFGDSRFELPMEETVFIQQFKVGAIKVELDYKPKKIDYSGIRSGKILEFVNFFILDGSRLDLPSLKLYGIFGATNLIKSLVKAWMPTIQETQLTRLLSGVSTVRSFVNIGEGLKDVLGVSIGEYKKDGRLLHSMRKGTRSFAKTSGHELFKLAAKIASGTQVLLEQSEEYLGGNRASNRARQRRDVGIDAEETHNFSKRRVGEVALSPPSQMLSRSIISEQGRFSSRRTLPNLGLDEADEMDANILDNALLLDMQKGMESEELLAKGDEGYESLGDEDLDEETFEISRKLISLYSNQPINSQEGLKLAYKALGHNLGDMRANLMRLRNEVSDSVGFQESLSTIVRSTPHLFLRPMIGTTEALLKTLMGISNEIDSKNIIEARDKYGDTRKDTQEDY